MGKNENSNPQVITEGTFAVPLVPTVTLCIALLGGAVTATLWITKTLGEINNNISQIRLAISDRWTSGHQREYSHQLQRSNPTIKVPDTDEIRRQINNSP